MTKNTEAKEKNWIIRSVDTPESDAAIDSIAEELGIYRIVAKLLYNRGYTNAASAKSFIYMESEILSDPFMLKDIEPGINRIRRAIERNEKITVYGDYDVDGTYWAFYVGEEYGMTGVDMTDIEPGATYAFKVSR